MVCSRSRDKALGGLRCGLVRRRHADMGEHWFWWLVTAAVLVWYSTVAVYVAVRGALDIKHMLARLSAAKDEDSK